MAAKYILAVLSIAFITAGTLRSMRDSSKLHPQARAWLLIGLLFGIVSAWLFYRA
jgi:hypothetical protein